MHMRIMHVQSMRTPSDRLGMKSNQLASLPTEIGNLGLLEHFDVSNNQCVHLLVGFCNG
jgi:hypothetical protein